MADQLLIDAAAPKIQDVYAKSENRAFHLSSDPIDPMVGILSAFYSVPIEYHSDLFNDFKEAAEAKDLRKLLDTISDWAATAELYANEPLAQEVQQAIQDQAIQNKGRPRIGDMADTKRH